MTSLRDVIAVLDQAYPPPLAEAWDAVGLVCGNPGQEVARILVAVDPSPAVVDEAIAFGADLLVVHHPLLLRPVNAVAADSPKGALLHRLIRAGCALFTAHTNADSAPGGVNDALCAAIGVIPERALEPAPRPSMAVSDSPGLVKLTVFAPPAEVEALIDALSAAGAGSLGAYDRCAYLVDGRGTFRPGPDASPAIGSPGVVEEVAETRIEMILPASAAADVVAAVRRVHSYEEPAFDLVGLLPVPSPPDDQAPELTTGPGVGIGRVGTLPHPVSLADFAAQVAGALPPTRAGVRVAGDLSTVVRRVAVCSGAGDSLLGAATAAGVDAYVTADLRHHTASEHLDAGGPALVEVSHWASEWPWCPAAAVVLASAFGERIEVRVSSLRTDPWAAHVVAPQVQGEEPQ